MQRLRLFPMLLPSLAEQYRIVARVNELMALCDRLEAARDEQERRREHLVAASFYRINSDANGEDFRSRARFHLDHLPRILIRTERISEFRKTILNLAVRGRIVPQDSKEESVSQLLDCIQLRKRSYFNACSKARILRIQFVRRRMPLRSPIFLALDTAPGHYCVWSTKRHFSKAFIAFRCSQSDYSYCHNKRYF